MHQMYIIYLYHITLSLKWPLLSKSGVKKHFTTATTTIDGGYRPQT